jgi:hypothetical protein
VGSEGVVRRNRGAGRFQTLTPNYGIAKIFFVTSLPGHLVSKNISLSLFLNRVVAAYWIASHSSVPTNHGFTFQPRTAIST